VRKRRLLIESRDHHVNAWRFRRFERPGQSGARQSRFE
jgi:hypothetical protein